MHYFEFYAFLVYFRIIFYFGQYSTICKSRDLDYKDMEFLMILDCDETIRARSRPDLRSGQAILYFF